MNWDQNRDLLIKIGNRFGNQRMGYNGDPKKDDPITMRKQMREDSVEEFLLFYHRNNYAYLYIENPGKKLFGKKLTTEVVKFFTELFGEEPSYLMVDTMSEREKRELHFVVGDYCLFAGWGNISKLRIR